MCYTAFKSLITEDCSPLDEDVRIACFVQYVFNPPLRKQCPFCLITVCFKYSLEIKGLKDVGPFFSLSVDHLRTTLMFIN